MLKIAKKASNGFYLYEDAFYCLDGNDYFPTLNGEITYKRTVADFFSEKPTTLGLTDENYNSLCWLFDTMYLRKQMTETERTAQKDELIENAFADILNDTTYEDSTTIDDIKARVTDEDIEVIQQWAIWYFTNYGEETLQHIPFTNENKTLPIIDMTIVGSQTADSMESTRYEWCTVLYQYLVNEALSHKNDEFTAVSSIYPTIANKEGLTCEVDGTDYKIGPFKVAAPSSDLTSNNYEITLTDRTNEITSYTVKDSEGNVINKKVNEIFDTEYYIYLPISANKISKLQLNLSYTKFGTKASVWTADHENYQPLVLLTKESEPVKDSISVPIQQPNYDLALRKYIIAVNDTGITDRKPNVDASKLADGSSKTAEYKHKKDALEVKAGDTITYRISVYNEGDIDAKATEIVDYLPVGLELDKDNETNSNYGWTVSEDGRVATTTVLNQLTIKAFDKTTLTSAYVDIVCKVADGATSGSVLTNIAEIKSDDIDDRDSTPDSISDSIDSVNKATYAGKDNKADLADSDYYYKGMEDDDDFEKVIVAGKAFDLSLQKFVTKVNGAQLKESREPKVDVTPLKNGATDATYTTVKTPVSVEVGDIVKYTIRVYNEGEVSGYAESVADYLPDGLGYLEEYNDNIENGWKVGTTDGVKKEKLSEIKNGSKNLKLEDFTGITDLNEAKVLTGPVKLTSTLLSSDDESNLLNAYDGSNKLSYKDIEITCIVLSDENLQNIAEITDDSDENKEEVTDRDSTPDTVDPNDYPGDDKDQDDHDYEILVVEKLFDLSLQKFVTKVNGKELSESREPKVDVTPLKNGSTNATYTTTKNPVLVEVGDIVTYKIRVYNEGKISGYAESVADYLPDGLGYLVNYNANIDNYWALPTDSGVETVKLSQIKNGTKNLKVNDFTGVSDLNNVEVVKGSVKLTSTALKSDSDKNLIAAFDDSSDKLSYKDIEITCIVLSDEKLKNIAEITDDSDEDKEEVIDRDSTPDTVNPNDYPGNDKDQDDHDYEVLTVEDKIFDLSLQKFITGVNDKEITDRVPKVTYNNGTISYEHPATPLEINTGDSVTYTIRVYNEGKVAGYAAEIGDDIPDGLVFDSENELNKKYGWKMYDANGNVTTDSTKAKEIRTDYLSKEQSEARKESALLEAFDSEKGNLFYLDIKAVFKVSVKSSDSTIINTAEITKDTDENGDDIDDIDSTPDNKKDGEDDIDKERIHVGYFDLALQKDLSKAVITEGSSTTEIPAVNGQLMKVEINRKKVNSTIVKFVYTITIKNEGTIPGYAKEIKDYIPEGLQFVESDNTNWKASSDSVITTTALAYKLLQPGETASVEVVLRWINGENNLGLKTNVAEISKDYNEANDTDDVDSTPDNKKDGEDDIDDAPVILSISTGRAQTYIILSTTVLVIISAGVIMIKKYVL